MKKLTRMDLMSIYSLYRKFPSVQTDTRKLKKDDVFFALKGPNFNGNTFAKQALDAGASFVIVDEDVGFEDARVIRVDDSLRCLQLLSSVHRDQFKIPFIAITGSNGKTTTKELIHAVLSSHFKTYTTHGNLNNHIGVPLTILGIGMDAEMAVIEMGANHQKEISSYCGYAKPDFGLITNIGKAHLEGFGGEEGVKLGKGELFAYLKNKGGTAFVNTDDSNIVDLAKDLDHKILYGSESADISGAIVSSDPFLKVQLKGEMSMEIDTRFVGDYNIQNVLAAVAVGKYFGVPEEKIRNAIKNYVPSNSRSQMIKKGTNTIIMDAYNANPGSMHAAIENLVKMRGENKVLILGDMKELGADSRKEHEQIIQLIDQYSWKEVALTGPEFSAIAHSYHSFENSEQAREWFNQSKIENSLILVKGSRSMKMEKVVE